MTQHPAASGNQRHGERRDDKHTPLLAMWYQTRAALADFTIPVLAGLKAAWLIVFSPVKYFKAYLYEEQLLAEMRTPFDVIWRALTHEERTPLDAAKFLFFGILAAALAGFAFDNSNRLSGLLAQTGMINGVTQQIPALAELALRLRILAENETIQAIQAFFDRDLISAIIELVATLFITMVFAYLFRLLAGRHFSATDSYSFWLYMNGMQYFTTGITFVFFKLFSLPAIGLPQLTPEIIFLVLEYAWLILWLYALPLIVLPRLFKDLTLRRTLLALLATHGIFMVTGWLYRAGFTTLLLLWSAVAERL